MKISSGKFFAVVSFLTFAATSMVVIAAPAFAANPIAGTPCKVNGQKIVNGAVIFACHPKVLGDTRKLIWYLKDKSPMPKTLPASAPAAALFAPCNPARTPYGRGADGTVFRCDVNSADTAYVWRDAHN